MSSLSKVELLLREDLATVAALQENKDHQDQLEDQESQEDQEFAEPQETQENHQDPHVSQ